MSTAAATELYRPSQDERTLACVSHLTIFVSSIGLLIAIGLWLYLWSKQQEYAAFQAAQAVIYQFVVMILTFALGAALVLFAFGAFGIGLINGADPDETAIALFFGVVVVLAIIVLSILALATYAYAIYAAVRSYQGRPFRIPGVASLVDMINPMPPVEPEGISG